jgi:hypothetical protein
VSLSRLALSALALVFAGSLLVTATLINLPAAFITVIATGLVRSTATKGTVRLLVGLATGFATWIIAGIIIADGWLAIVAGFAVALGGVAALFIWPPLINQAVILVGRVRLRDRVGLLPPVLEARDRVVAEVREATD